MIFKSALLAQASGSVGGATYSRNKGGMYIRSRSLVITPKTSQQVTAQNAIKTLSARWATLTSTQRQNWKTYAINTPILNKVGESRVIPELSWYIRCNSPRLQAIGASAVVDDAPTIFGVGTLTAPTFTADHATGLSVSFTNTDAWATTTGGFLFLYQSRPQSVTRKFLKGNFRYVFNVVGNTTTPPTSPQTHASLFTLTAGQQVLLRCRASLSDGRLSAAIILAATVT